MLPTNVLLIVDELLARWVLAKGFRARLLLPRTTRGREVRGRRDLRLLPLRRKVTGGVVDGVSQRPQRLCRLIGR
jgi:hypothetical protein